jgi:hypothetical protein
MLLFRSEQHVDRWCKQWRVPRGGILSLEQGWRLSQLWYGDRLSPDWQPMSAEQAQAVLSEVGLTGEFWVLR